MKRTNKFSNLILKNQLQNKVHNEIILNSTPKWTAFVKTSNDLANEYFNKLLLSKKAGSSINVESIIAHVGVEGSEGVDFNKINLTSDSTASVLLSQQTMNVIHLWPL